MIYDLNDLPEPLSSVIQEPYNDEENENFDENKVKYKIKHYLLKKSIPYSNH